MSLNPKAGHLYHDGNISNAFTVLDAKEKMKTREINAREAKSFDKYSGVIERAKKVCKRQNEWEQLSVRKHLNSINSKTPSLANSLRRQSEMMFSRSSKGARYPENQLFGFVNGLERHSAADPRKTVNVSSWSVYSHLMHGEPDRLNNRTSEGMSKITPASKYRSWKYKDSCASAKTENLVRRADQVTRTLHSLYTKSFERRWKEKGMSVLDILNRNSKEELQKALFVLRGTPTGDAIEDILRERERVYKASSVKNPSDKEVGETEDMLKLSDDVFVTEFGETVMKPVGQDKNSPRTNSDRDSGHTPQSNAKQSTSDGSVSSGLNLRDELLFSDNVKKSENNDNSLNNWNDFENPLTIKEVFERDDSFLLSSMLANPSEADTEPTNNKWRDIFKAPELWKQGAPVNKEIVKIKPVSIVTLTGKHRQTMLK